MGDEKLACSLCGYIYPGKADEVPQAVISNRTELPVHLGNIAWLVNGSILSHDMVDVLGQKMVGELGRLVPIVNEAGAHMTSHSFLIPREVPGLIRGNGGPPPPGTCAVCGRLRYWPGPDPKERYMLRRYWRDYAFTIMNGWFLCSERFYNEKLKPLTLGRLGVDEVPIVDEPRDGLPADYAELFDTLRGGTGNIAD